jgi:hypothetical protein
MNSFNHAVTDLPEQESASPPALALVFPAQPLRPNRRLAWFRWPRAWV